MSRDLKFKASIYDAKHDVVVARVVRTFSDLDQVGEVAEDALDSLTRVLKVRADEMSALYEGMYRPGLWDEEETEA